MKAVYFVKRTTDPVKTGNFRTAVLCGEMSHLPLDQLQTILDLVRKTVLILDLVYTCT